MKLNRIGDYKGFEVFKVSKYDIREKDCMSDTMYVIEETGDMILNGEIVAKVNLKKMSVDELPRSERRRYFTERPKPQYSRGHRAETKVVDEVAYVPKREPVVSASPDNLFAGMDMIDKYIESALAQNLIPEFKMPVLEV